MCEDELYSLVGNNFGLSLRGVNEREYEADRLGPQFIYRFYAFKFIKLIQMVTKIPKETR